jgi:hypothetical protein
MTPITWFYTWSSKDEVFHHILKSCFDSEEEFIIHSQKTEDHRATAVKFLEQQPENTHIIISQANFIVDNTQKLYKYLQILINYDLVAIKDNSSPSGIATDILFVRNTQHVRDYLKNNKATDLNNLNYTVFNQSGFCNSQIDIQYIMKSMVLHLISYHIDENENLFDKLFIASLLIDITTLEPLIPYDIWNRIIDEHKELSTNLPIMYFNYKSKPWENNFLLKGSQTEQSIDAQSDQTPLGCVHIDPQHPARADLSGLDHKAMT